MAAATVARRRRERSPTTPIASVDEQEQPSSTIVAAPPKCDSKKEELTLDERLCAVCLTEKVEVMLLPCRHAVLCKGCAVIVQRVDAGSRGERQGQGMGDGRCPICRERIMGVVQGTFEEDYVRLVTAAEARLEWVQGSAYEGMYNHIKPLMLTGALSAAGSFACFVLLPPPVSLVTGVALAGTAFVVGYLPWFATTAGAFEAENLSSAQGSSLRLFSREDLSRPVTCFAKATMIAVAAPVAATVFFAPYVCYAYVLRPLSRYVLYGSIRGTCFSFVYIVRPACKAFAWMCVKTCQGFKIAASALYDYILKPLGKGIAWTCVKTWQGLGLAARALYDYVLAPTGCAISTAAKALFSYVLLPCGRGFWAAITASASVVAKGVMYASQLTWTYVLSPAGHVACRAVEMLGHFILDYVLVPIVRATHVMWHDALVPLGRGLWAAMCASGRCLAVGARALYIMSSCLAHAALAGGAVALYLYILVPGGRLLMAAGAALAAGAAAVARGISFAATTIYTTVLVPVGTGVSAAASAVASAVYSYVLVPGGLCLKTVALLVAGGVWLVYDGVLRPVGAALAVAAHTVGGAIYVAASEGATLVGHVGSQVAVGVGSAIEMTGTLFWQVREEMMSAWSSLFGCWS
eukprot:CAMPEP_0115400590 /NCGR_PEP_ID=MMETSP0271-20121206/15433_1 /TAXON_ID=71861 /ORGANISM="Scrippsiella trochoidea, Strain CCMP3099" /LENGTH=635 /DNA_ID=CAMNT_0002824443 /DNA_START=58 /DNA_END=1964 /DNA_ORIENTATION=+